ncbi:unnamed protein product, partial [Amoebophrya sp. A25]|eukprot:GSA25T00002932001.1
MSRPRPRLPRFGDSVSPIRILKANTFDRKGLNSDGTIISTDYFDVDSSFSSEKQRRRWQEYTTHVFTSPPRRSDLVESSDAAFTQEQRPAQPTTSCRSSHTRQDYSV